jgi:hypothetical protein
LSLAPVWSAINAQEFTPDSWATLSVLPNYLEHNPPGCHVEPWFDHWTWDSLIHLSNLTHLSFNSIRSENGVIVWLLHQVITVSPPSLRAVVVWVVFKGEVDMRAVVAYLGILKESLGWQPDSGNLICPYEYVLREWGEICHGEHFCAEAEQAAGHSPHQNMLQ